MTTLTSAASITKRLVIAAILVSLLLFLSYTVFSFIRQKLISLKPPPPLTLITTFGRLPEVKFPQQNFPSDIKFTIETLSGQLPEASPTAKIYFMPQKQQGLLTNIRANQDAKKIGFTTSFKNQNKKLIYKELMKEFVIDPISRDFSYTYDYQNDGTVFIGTAVLNVNSATSQANNFLSKIDALPSDFDGQKPITTMVTYNGALFIPTGEGNDQQNATAARVDYFRKKIQDIPVVTPNFNEGNIYVIVSKQTDLNKQVIKAQRTYKEVEYDSYGLYPLRNIQQAWDELLAGHGYITVAGNSTFTKRVIIRDAYLAYYDDPQGLSYLMPVYVFVGDGNFIAYSQAVSKEWLVE